MLLEIQEKKINEVVSLLSTEQFDKNHPLYFQSPTGSGKTLMLARIIEEFKKNNPNENFLFLVASISTGGIEKQNYESLYNSQLKGSNFNVEHIPSGLTTPLRPRYHTDVLTIGEASFKKGSNLFKLKLLESYLEKVSENKRIIFIRDEAHIGTKINTNDTSQNLSKLNRYFYKQLWLSATLENGKEQMIPHVCMTLSEAQDAGLIKNNISLFDGDIEDNENEEHLFELACKKLKKLWGSNEHPGIYRKISDIKGQIIKPALLVQISSKTKGEEEIKQIINICKKHNLNYAYTLSKNKEAFQASGLLKSRKITRNELQKNDSDIDVIIFKFAIATGWNIPRACILSQYRNIDSDNLRIQTLGRVLRNIFVGDIENFNKFDDDEQKEILTCYLYSAHQSAKQYETSILKLKDSFINEKVKKTYLSQTPKDVEGRGYLAKHNNDLVRDYISLFNKDIKGTNIVSLLNKNKTLDIKIPKKIFSGNLSVKKIDQSLDKQGKIGKHTINWLEKTISNKFQLEKEFNNWLRRNSPYLKKIFNQVFKQIGYMNSVLFKCKILQDISFSKKIIAQKRHYQTDSEKESKYDLEIKEINLPRIQFSNNPKENMLNAEIRHLSQILTTTINGENKLFYNSDPNSSNNNSPERHFLQDLDSFVKYNKDFLYFIHRNERSKESVSYIYRDENGNKHEQYPDYILRTKNGTTIICEIKTICGGIEYINSIKHIEKGYLRNSKKITDYFFGIIKHADYRYQLVYYKEGKRVPMEFLDLKEKFKDFDFDGLTELDVLFDIIKCYENNRISIK